jgi:hypothetical protein
MKKCSIDNVNQCFMMMIHCRINDQTYLVKILYCQILLQIMVCGWVKERSIKEIWMNISVTITMAYTNVS